MGFTNGATLKAHLALKCQQSGHFIKKAVSIQWNLLSPDWHRLCRLQMLQLWHWIHFWRSRVCRLDIKRGKTTFGNKEWKWWRHWLWCLGSDCCSGKGEAKQRQSRHFPKAKCYKVCGTISGTLTGKPFLDLCVPQRVAATAERTVSWWKHGWPASGSR